MPVSNAVRRYYAERIFALGGRDQVAPNFRPLGEPPDGRFAVEGCRGGGKNRLEVQVLLGPDTVREIRMACGLCNPAMLVAADVLADWARGRAVAALLAADPGDPRSLDPFFERLGGRGRPADAREKFQYALVAVQNAVRDARGLGPRPVPEFPEPVPGAEDADEDADEAGG